jgi:predicted nucleic acid-binding protein
MNHYADTGFVLSLHFPESTSQAASKAMESVAEPLPVTRLLALELRNALRLGVFRKSLTEAEQAVVWTSFLQDIAQGYLEEVREDPAMVFAEAESLCDRFTAATGVRTVDLLHVATARVLGRSRFLSFDRRQRDLAAAAGLQVLP